MIGGRWFEGHHHYLGDSMALLLLCWSGTVLHRAATCLCCAMLHCAAICQDAVDRSVQQ